LRREVGLFGAVMMGLGSIIGTGVFVSIGVAAGEAGPSVTLAIVVAALVAVCNGLSSASLAANHPVSGGTYEYGYRWLTPGLGFTAGWMFLCAKSASAATATLGLAGYLLDFAGFGEARWLVPLALVLLVIVTALVLGGIRRSSRTNIFIVALTLAALGCFVAAGLPSAFEKGTTHLRPFFAPVAEQGSPAAGFLEACALMFVAYTGYGRIATLAEEVRQPRRTIPTAIIVTLFASMSLYAAVGFVGVAVVGAEEFATAGISNAAPLEAVASRFEVPGIAAIVSLGAAAAMVGVLLNLILGLSRVALAMARRRELPALFGRINETTATPAPAVVLVSLLIAGLALLGSVKTAWSFSAFTVLIYYAITNLAATRLKESERLYPRWIPWTGLTACLFLAFWVEPRIWAVGLAMIAAGFLWHIAARRLSGAKGDGR
jgi:APA family basic amino acid/polyamine antiporter